MTEVVVTHVALEHLKITDFPSQVSERLFFQPSTAALPIADGQ
jgi:hypothetical protein